MTESTGRVIKPPSEEFANGRIFTPLAALRYKKWLKFILAAFAIYGVFLFAFFGPPLVTIFIFEFIPFNLFFVKEGWVIGSIVYWGLTPIWLVPAMIWTYFYVKNIEYSVAGWDGGAMPDIYQRKGIITVTKKHVPFRTITNVKTRVGIFDRLFGIGNVKIETAGESGGVQATGVLTLILGQLMANDAEEVIEGITCYEAIEQFILRELRGFKPVTRGGTIFTERTLRAFQEIRDVIREEL
ncbi:MAG: PH domain-containing protein [Candidatus Hodarchaeota archaeon]